MPSISSELVSVNRRASAAILRGVGVGARPRSPGSGPQPATTKLPDSTSSPASLSTGSALTGEQRLVDLEPVGRRARRRRTGSGRRCGARGGRRARPPRPRSPSTAPSRTTRARGALSTASRSSVRLARSSWTMPMSDVGDEDDAERGVLDRPDDEDRPRASMPRMALKRVKTFARTISPMVRLVRSPVSFTSPARDALGDLGRGQARWRRLRVGGRGCRPAAVIGSAIPCSSTPSHAARR